MTGMAHKINPNCCFQSSALFISLNGQLSSNLFTIYLKRNLNDKWMDGLFCPFQQYFIHIKQIEASVQ